MKTIKILILSLFISCACYSQDTIWVMINGTNMHEFDEDMKIIKSTDHFNNNIYKDYKINIDKNQILCLHLYDSCKHCKNKSINNRKILVEDRVFGEIITKKLASSSNVYYINGEKIESITVLKPNE
jgi:hypothetical protein